MNKSKLNPQQVKLENKSFPIIAFPKTEKLSDVNHR